MQNYFEKYIQSVASKFVHEETSEMGYRTDFELLIKGVFESINVKRIDHDARTKDGNKPDFVVLKHEVPILYIEAKTIGVSLNKIEKSEQMARYFGYTNLVLTDYVEFRFYRNGERYEDPIKIANYDIKNRTIEPIPENYEHVAKSLIDFTQSHKEPIKSGRHLSKIMGGKAQRIRDNLRHFLALESDKNEDIYKVYETIKEMLVHDLTLDAFADMYAQTLVYGLFVARYYDETPDTFSRQEARELVPASNPFLQHFFDHIAGPNFDKRLSYIADELCTVFQHANTKELIEDYMGDADPVIHFYEDFLKEYDPKLRKKMGAYYTPLPIVRFIVRSVDYILQKNLNLPDGLADTSKLPNNKHRVQILDPAVGTGTFISATIRIIYERLKKQGQDGRWPAYVHHDLLPRLHGFELMMAPYTIAHLKLSLAFKQTKFWKFHRRLGIYLTNSLEKSEVQQSMTSFGFAESIAEEAKEADKIKNENPIMVVMGNPPYSISSNNKGDWILDLIEVYKQGLGERNIQSISDDYIKFIRLAENFVEKNSSGVVGMITNNTFIDGIMLRQMRKHLLETFDDIYIIDLHGNSKRKEKTKDGGKDENVFDIQQGVSINIFVKKEVNNNKLATVFHTEMLGKKDEKFQDLNKSNINNINWTKVNYSDPYYFFVPKDFSDMNDYEKGYSLNDLFVVNTSGVKTHNDSELVNFDGFDNNNYEYTYRPFDNRFIEYDIKKVVRHRFSVMKHLMKGTNLSMISGRQGQVVGSMMWNLIYVSKQMIDTNVFYRGGGIVFPLYILDDDGEQTSNLNEKIVGQLEGIVGSATTPKEIFDYVYAVLHSPSYREKYKEFLKIDFPKIPYPKNSKTFKSLVALGAELRSLHLMESSKINNFVTTFPIVGTDEVEKITYKDGKVYINVEQYFGDVSELAWNFYIGGYQPAQKWLKDRKNRILTNADIEHYQRIIVVLSETEKIMRKIDQIKFNK